MEGPFALIQMSFQGCAALTPDATTYKLWKASWSSALRYEIIALGKLGGTTKRNTLYLSPHWSNWHNDITEHRNFEAEVAAGVSQYTQLISYCQSFAKQDSLHTFCNKFAIQYSIIHIV